MARTQHENDAFYHVYNRGTEGRDIFLDDTDRKRFLHYLYVANDVIPVPKVLNPHAGEDVVRRARTRTTIVNILAHALMPNHFHLVLQQRVDGGVSKFMQKVGTGLTMYFNEKYKHKGVLLQGSFKSKPIEDEEYLARVVRYVHLNPVELFEPTWKEDGIKSRKGTIIFLRDFRWSSYQDYIGIKNYPSLLARDIIEENLLLGKDHEEFVCELLNEDNALGVLAIDNYGGLTSVVGSE